MSKKNYSFFLSRMQGAGNDASDGDSLYNEDQGMEDDLFADEQNDGIHSSDNSLVSNGGENTEKEINGECSNVPFSQTITNVRISRLPEELDGKGDTTNKKDADKDRIINENDDLRMEMISLKECMKTYSMEKERKDEQVLQLNTELASLLNLKETLEDKNKSLKKEIESLKESMKNPDNYYQRQLSIAIDEKVDMEGRLEMANDELSRLKEMMRDRMQEIGSMKDVNREENDSGNDKSPEGKAETNDTEADEIEAYKSKLMELIIAGEENDKELKEKENTIRRMEEVIEKREMKLEETNRTIQGLTERNEELGKELKGITDEKEKEMMEMKRVLEEKEKRLSSIEEEKRTLEEQLLQRQKEKESLSQTNNDKLQHMEELLRQKDDGMNERIREMQEQMDSMEKQYKESEKSMAAEYERVLKELKGLEEKCKEGEEKQREMEKEEMEKQRDGEATEAKLHQQIKEKEEIISHLNNALEKERELSGNMKKVASELNDSSLLIEQKELEISSLRRENENQASKIELLEQEVNANTKEKEELSNRINMLGQEVESRQMAIEKWEKQQETIERDRASLKELQNQLKSMSEYSNMEELLRKRDEEIQFLGSTISEKEERIEAMDQRIKALECELAENEKRYREGTQQVFDKSEPESWTKSKMDAVVENEIESILAHQETAQVRPQSNEISDTDDASSVSLSTLSMSTFNPQGLLEEKEKLQIEKEQLLRRCSAYDEQIAIMKHTIESLTIDVQSSHDDVERMKAANSTQNDTINSLKNTINEERKYLSQQEVMKNSYDKKLSDFEHRVTELQTDMSAAKEEWEMKKKGFKEEADAAMKKSAELERIIEELKKRIEELKKRIDEYENSAIKDMEDDTSSFVSCVSDTEEEERVCIPVDESHECIELMIKREENEGAIQSIHSLVDEYKLCMDAQKMNEGLRTIISNKDQEIENMKEELKEQEKVVCEKKAAVEQLQKELEDNESQQAVLNEEIQRNRIEMETMKTTLSTLKTTKTAADENTREKERIIDELNRVIIEKEQQINQCAIDYNERIFAYQKMESENNELKTSCELLNKEIQTISKKSVLNIKDTEIAKIKGLEEEKERMQGMIRDKDKTITRLSSEIGQAKKYIRGLLNQNQQYTEVEAMKSAIKKYQNEIKQLKMKSRGGNEVDVATDVNNEVRKLQHDLKKRDEFIKQLNLYVDQKEEELKACREQLKRIVELINSKQILVK